MLQLAFAGYSNVYGYLHSSIFCYNIAKPFISVIFQLMGLPYAVHLTLSGLNRYFFSQLPCVELVACVVRGSQVRVNRMAHDLKVTIIVVDLRS